MEPKEQKPGLPGMSKLIPIAAGMAKQTDDGKTCICGAKVDGKLHPCPFQSEINGFSGDYCNCCDECAHQCAMDI